MHTASLPPPQTVFPLYICAFSLQHQEAGLISQLEAGDKVQKTLSEKCPANLAGLGPGAVNLLRKRGGACKVIPTFKPLLMRNKVTKKYPEAHGIITLISSSWRL